VNHRDGIGNTHVATLTFHAHYRLHPIAEIGRATFAAGIVLPRQSANTGTSQRFPASHITGTTGPNVVDGVVVLFPSVDVSDFNIAG
jgi:hypothetical protein